MSAGTTVPRGSESRSHARIQAVPALEPGREAKPTITCYTCPNRLIRVYELALRPCRLDTEYLADLDEFQEELAARGKLNNRSGY